MKVNFEVHESHLPLWERDDWRYAFIMGGRGNGRSGTASRYVMSRLLGKEYTRGAIMRAVREDIRTSCWQEIRDRIEEQEIRDAFDITEHNMHIARGVNSIQAHGYKAGSGSQTAKLKSLAGYNLIWNEEAEETGEDEFMKLDDSLRTTKGSIRIVFTLNTPPKNHWIIKRFFDLDPTSTPGFFLPKLKKDAKDAIYIGGTFRDNLPNIDPATAARYAKYRETNPDYYWQMIEGLCPEVVMGRIYKDWKVVDTVPHEARLMGYGLDFGFDPDPAAIVAIYWYNGGFLLHEILYQTELLNSHLISTFKALPKAPIIADNAEPKSIAELQAAGLNVIPCEKGADSVNHGIKHVQSLPISYTSSSTNIAYESENYSWKIMKDGETIGVEDPKKPNHLMSAARYGLTTLAASGTTYDPHAKEREAVQVSVTRRKLQKNGAR
jgi:phage terminase large subunit